MLFSKLTGVSFNLDTSANAIQDLGERLGRQHPDFQEIKQIANDLFRYSEVIDDVSKELKK